MGNKKNQIDQYPNLDFKPARITKALEIANDNPLGFTITNDMSEMPQSGYAVALAATQNSFGLSGFLRALAFAIDNDLHFGGWLDEKSGKYYFDAVRVFPEGKLDEAVDFATQEGQLAIYSLHQQYVIGLPLDADTIIVDMVLNGPDTNFVLSKMRKKQEVVDPPGTLHNVSEEDVKRALQFKEGDILIVTSNKYSEHTLPIGTKLEVVTAAFQFDGPYYEVVVFGDPEREWFTVNEKEMYKPDTTNPAFQ